MRINIWRSIMKKLLFLLLTIAVSTPALYMSTFEAAQEATSDTITKAISDAEDTVQTKVQQAVKSFFDSIINSVKSFFSGSQLEQVANTAIPKVSAVLEKRPADAPPATPTTLKPTSSNVPQEPENNPAPSE